MTKNQDTNFYYRHKNTVNLVLRCLIVFIIPIITGLIFFKQREIHPFGENSLLSVDLWGQYFPMYRQFSYSNSFSEAMYSWNGALGFNNFVQSAFYCRSLFLLIFKIVPFSSSIAYINYVCLLRLGISAVTCLLFLEAKFKKKSPAFMAISISYGLCAYSIAFIMQFMWTDCIMYAPLILLGLERLMDGKSPILYVITLALTIYTNFYVGFGVCLFTLFYFIAETVKRTEFVNKAKFPHCFANRKEIKKSILRFAVYSLLSGAMTAVIAIPTLKGLSLSMSANNGKVDFSQWYHTFSENINAMLPQTGISLEYGVANIATGLFMFILIPLYFLNTSVKFSDKLASGAFLGALYCGLNYNPMDYVFNGFHFANQLPGRWSFLFSLALVIVAANGIAKRKGINQKNIICSYIVGSFFLLFSRYSTLSPIKEESLNTWFKLITVFCVLLSIYITFARYNDKEAAAKIAESSESITDATAENTADEKTASTMENNENPDASSSAEDTPAENAEVDPSVKKKAIKDKFFRGAALVTSFAIAALITYDVCTNAVYVASRINGGVGTSNMTSYLKVTEVLTDNAAIVKNGSDDFYRVESNLGWTFNDGQLADYKGMTYYGSTLNGNVYNFLRFMGNRIYAQSVSTVYNNSSTVQNSLFGIRYIVDRGRNLNERLPGINLIQSNDNCMIWENTTTLPLAYATSEKVRSFELTDEIRAIQAQNNLVNLMYGEDINVYEKHEPSAFSYENCTLNPNDNWNENHFYRQDAALPVKFNYTYVCPSEQPIYIEHNFRAGQMLVTVNGAEKQVDIGAELFKYIGTYPAGTEINISVQLEGIGIGCYGVNLYSFNTEKWQNVYNKLNSSSLDVTSFKNTRIEGTLNMAEAGVVFTSIPQDGGWKVYVDGKKVNDFTIADTLIGFMTSAGTHEVTFEYHVPGYAAGLTISIISILLAVFCILYHHTDGDLKKLKMVRSKASSAAASKTSEKPAAAPSVEKKQDDIDELINEISDHSKPNDAPPTINNDK